MNVIISLIMLVIASIIILGACELAASMPVMRWLERFLLGEEQQETEGK